MEVPLDAFSYSTTLLWNGRNSPLSVIKALMDLFDEHTDPVFTDEHKRFMLERLVNYYWLTHYTDEDGKTYQLPKIEKLLRAELDKLPKSDEGEPKKFDWPTTKKHLTTLPDTPTKIAHLLECEAEYQQNCSDIAVWGKSYAEKCQTEIKKLRDLGLATVYWRFFSGSHRGSVKIRLLLSGSLIIQA